jgi:Transglycosylase SLT domain
MALFGGMFGDNNDFGPTDPAALYGGLLSPKQNSALSYQGLLAAAGALGQAAMPSRMPVPLGAALGMAAGAMGQGQQSAAENALKGSLVGLQGQHLNYEMGMGQNILNAINNGFGSSAGGSPGNVPGEMPAAAGGGNANASPSVSGSSDLLSLGQKVAAKYGIPWDVFSHQIAGESGWNPKIGASSAGAQGIAQFIPDTAKKYGVDVTDPQSSLDGAARYMRDLYDQSGSWTGALTGYLSGKPGPELTSVTSQNPQYAAAYAAARQADQSGNTGKQYAQAGATDTQSDLGSGAPPPTPGELITNGAVPGLISNRAQGEPTPLARSLVAAGVNPPTQPPGLLNQDAPRIPGQRLLAGPQEPATPPVAMPASASVPPPGAMPQGMVPGGAASLNGADPRMALMLSALGPMAGLGSELGQAYQNTPAYQAAVAGAKGWAGVAPQLYTKWNSPMEARTNAMVLNPATGAIIARNPALPLGYTAGGTAANPIAEEVPGAIAGIAKSEQSKEQGKYSSEFGAIPGVNFQGQPFNSGTATAPAAGAPAASTPSNDQPITTPRGTQLPPISQQFMPQSPAELEHSIPAWQGKTDAWNEAIAPARQAEMRLGTIAEAFKMTEPGAFSTQKAELAAALKSLGIDPTLVTQTKPDAVQEALHDNMLTTLPLLKAATPRPSQIEFMSVSENREHPNLQPAANLRMLGEDMALVRQAQQLPADWNMAQQQGWRNPQSFETAWSNLNPLDKAREKAQQDIGPLKGMNGTKPLDPATLQGAQNAILRGADRAKIIQRLQDNGYDTSKF